jgi:hypothetical protein
MHPRQVSSGSEFPMRADSYTAREISTRMIDPLDQPTALPNNLPYPQLQQQYQIGGGMKPSPSMQSMASVSSKKGFFSSAIGRIGGKRDNYTLGPPSGNYQRFSHFRAELFKWRSTDDTSFNHWISSYGTSKSSWILHSSGREHWSSKCRDAISCQSGSGVGSNVERSVFFRFSATRQDVCAT